MNCTVPQSVIPSEGPGAQRKAPNRGISVYKTKGFLDFAGAPLEMTGLRPQRFRDGLANWARSRCSLLTEQRRGAMEYSQ